LARDCALFKVLGFACGTVTPFDLFPGTGHVESVVCLSREKADDCEDEPKMISDERSKYKSWSNLKKQMNDLLCDSLKDKISYFYTSYHEVHNAYGRATINYNKKEMVAFSWVEMYAQEREVSQLYQEGKKVSYGELEKGKWIPECKLCDADFINSLTIYLKTDIAISLHSDNYLLRVFAYMDRRVGKRTLIKIKDDVEKLPDWVKQFYRIRCEADGIIFPPKRITDESIVCLVKQNFRMATQDDAAQVLSLYESAKSGAFCVWNESYPSMIEIEHDLETGNLYVMTDGSKIIGAISVVPENELDGFDCWSCKDGKEIARVVIDKAHQGHGLSFEMVQNIVPILLRNGCKAIHLSVVKSNIPAYKTYRKAGFSVVGEAQMYGNDYYLMEKAINTNSLPKGIQTNRLFV
jgi:ribosomal protein S18 acetylase RimI-like enzyme